MVSPSLALPGLISLPRITTLVVSLLVALSSGTNYVYSAYAPQLGGRLNINHTQLSMIGLSGNMGVYSSGPVWGRIIDKKGPKLPLALGFVLLLSGYSGIRFLYNSGSGDATSSISTFSLCVLVACGFITGSGGCGGFTGAVNATAKTFPDRARATTTGIVISGFGLSAFFFSTVARVAFPGDTSSFLLLLALGTSFPMILGFFLVRPIPLPLSEQLDNHDAEARAAGVDAVVLQHDSEQTHLLAEDEEESEEGHFGHCAAPTTPASEYLPDAATSVELSPPRHPSQHRPLRSVSRDSKNLHDGLPNVYGRALFFNSDFWLIWFTLSLLSGTGLTYINNVGAMSQALCAKGNPAYDQMEALKWQAAQVSAISVMNFSGRIFIGLVSDFAKSRLKLPRSYCLALVSLFFILSQLTASGINDVKDLWIASALLGLAHGSVFSLFPTVCIEWFGLPHFSENWGYLSLSPMLGGNLFSLAFGRNLDAHAPPEVETDVLSTTATQCLEGKQCYVATLHLTTAACFLALLLSVWAGWRDRKKIAALPAASRGHEVVWEAED